MTSETAAKNMLKELLADLTDRRGLRQEWESIDEDVRKEIKKEWTAIFLKWLKRRCDE